MKLHRNGLLSADFEQSKRLFKKKNVLNGAGFEASGRMDVKSRLLVLIVCGAGFGLLLFALPHMMVGAGPRIIRHPEEFHFVTVNAVIWMDRASTTILPVSLGFWSVFEVMALVNLIPGKTLPLQVAFASFYVLGLFLPLTVLIVFPLFCGLTLSSMGWVGLSVQGMIGLLCLARMFWSRRQYVCGRLYGDVKEQWDIVAWFSKFMKVAGPFLFLLVVLNMYFFHIGSVVSESPNVFSILYGWLPLLTILIYGAVLAAMLPQMVSNYYFVRYAKQYRKAYKFTDIEWYGKGRVWVNHLFKQTKK